MSPAPRPPWEVDKELGKGLYARQGSQPVDRSRQGGRQSAQSEAKGGASGQTAGIEANVGSRKALQLWSAYRDEIIDSLLGGEPRLLRGRRRRQVTAPERSAASDPAPAREAASDPAPARTLRDRPADRVDTGFAVWVGVLTSVGLALRIAFAATGGRWSPANGVSDPFYYHLQAAQLASGLGFHNPWAYVVYNQHYPSALHPPLTSLLLMLCDLVGLHSIGAQLVFSAVLSVTAVPLIGARAVMIGGRVSGLAAAAVTAFYPGFVIYSGNLGAEAFLIPLAALALLLAYLLIRKPTWLRAAGLGVTCGLMALDRSEMVLSGVLLVIPALFVLKKVGVGRRVLLGAFSLGMMGLVLVPWSLFTLTSFARPALLSTQNGLTMAWGNCQVTYEGTNLGYWSNSCLYSYEAILGKRAEGPAGAMGYFHNDESLVNNFYQTQALKYMAKHVGSLPKVMGARVGLSFYLFRPGFYTRLLGYVEKWPQWMSNLETPAYYLLASFALVGGVAMRLKRQVLSPLIGVFFISVVTIAIEYASPRFRVEADVVMAALAGVGAGWLWETCVHWVKEQVGTRRRGGEMWEASESPTRPTPSSAMVS